MDRQYELTIYTGEAGEVEINFDFEEETVWLSSYQIAEIYGKERSTIQRHIKNIYSTGELDEGWTCVKNAQVQKEGERLVNREISLYNLDIILAVGYRVNSKKATEFRKWATQVLRKYLLNGYALNQQRLKEKGLSELEQTLNFIKKNIENLTLSTDEAWGLLDIIAKYANSWILLQKYDEDQLPQQWETLDLIYKLQAQEAYVALSQLKTDLLAKNEATELFAQAREKHVLEGIFWNIYQTFWGKELYPSIEEKAAHLLYFIVKDHPFADGNKRSWAFLFILFLAKNHLLFDQYGERKINDRALVAITLLIAQSNPKDKELMVKLILNLIK